MDGGSTDESLKIIEDYSEELHYWESNSDHGQAHAINKGFKMATGDIVSWLNSDDKLCGGALHCIAEYFSNHPNKYLIHGSGLYFDDKGRYWYANKNYKDIQSRYITHFAFDLQPSVFFRRQVFDEIGLLDEEFNLHFDTEFFVRIALNYGILKINENLSLFRQHNLRKSNIEYPKMKYPKEFVSLYSRVLRSFQSVANYEDVDRYVGIAKYLSLFTHDDVKYSIKNTFNSKELERSFFIYLQQCCEFYYLGLDYERVLRILSVIKKELPDHYENDRDLLRIAIRLPIINILRKIPQWILLGMRLKIREFSNIYSRRYLIKK